MGKAETALVAGYILPRTSYHGTHDAAAIRGAPLYNRRKMHRLRPKGERGKREKTPWVAQRSP